MSRSLNELTGNLKDLIIDLQSDARNSRTLNKEKYNNLKISMNPSKNPHPHLTIQVSMSEAVYDLKSGEKLSGGLGPDEKYVQRWLSKGSILESLTAVWVTIVEAEKDKK